MTSLRISMLLFQLATPTRQVAPTLAFPEIGLDDPVAYQGYQTRFFKDVAGNTVQIYVDNRNGRLVHLLADAENESIGFTARVTDTGGRPATLRWASDRAEVSGGGAARARTLVHRLEADASHLTIGWFLLGSMRVERDFQYAERYKAPFAAGPFVVPEMQRLVEALGRLDSVTRKRHLSYVNAATVPLVRARLQPTITTQTGGPMWVARVVQASLDGRDTLTLELRVDPARVTAVRAGDSISFAARAGTTVPFTVAISTTGHTLTPLARDEIFNADFMKFLATTRADMSSVRARWLEREVRGVELLASREKLMAGLPAYATYFGRDMMVSALMMGSVWRTDMSAFVIASALRKLGPLGDVSHEEALGGQADREAADEYARLLDGHARALRDGDRRRGDSLLARADVVLRDHRTVRENYHMIDDEFQLPILEARWLGDRTVPRERKRAFLLDSSDGEPRVRRMLRELALVARMTAAYAARPIATNLVSFPQRDSTHWQSASWRDSEDGYAGGRFAMDVNAIWVPHALESIGVIFDALKQCGIAPDSAVRQLPPASGSSASLAAYARDAASLRHAVDVWRHAADHFVVTLDAGQVRARVAARIAALPDRERRYWTDVLSTTKTDQNMLTFLAIALDAGGHPIGVANTDPATRLFLLDGASETTRADVLRDVRLFVRPYPAGLFIDRVGPVVANDAYAPSAIWPRFEADRYHGPRVVWGREVNLFLLGAAKRLAWTHDRGEIAELREAIQRVQGAVQASGFHSELWSYEVSGGHVGAVRYGTGSDVQLWSTTDLAVQFALSRVPR